MPEGTLVQTPQGAPIGAPETGAPVGTQEPNQQTQQQTPQTQTPQTVPYERLEAVSRQNQEYRAQLRQLQEQVQTLSQPFEKQREAADRQKAEQEFWKDPFAAVENTKRQMFEQFQRTVAETNDLNAFQSVMGELKNSPAYNPELDKAMAQFVATYNLQAIGRANAVKAAYEGVTGQKWGEWKDSNYSTRSVKERLGRSGAGSGTKGHEGMTQEAFDNISLAEYEKDPAKYNKALQEYVQSLQ